MKVLVFGSNGLVGSSLLRILSRNKKIKELIPSTRKDTDLFSLRQTIGTINKHSPDIIINAAAKVGGIVANNTQRTSFIIDNLKINMNILQSIINKPQIKLINLGSSCIYPLNAENPINEDSLMTGKLEPTNSPYAMAKLTAIEIGKSITIEYGHKILNLMPTNLYGPNDNFSETESHVIPGLISRMNKAKNLSLKTFTVWGTGKPLREFLHTDDLSKAIIFILENNIDKDIINVGSNNEISIKDLVFMIKKIINYDGEIVFDKSYPDGNPRKLLDTSILFKAGWKPEIELIDGIKSTYDWYINHLEK